MIFAFSEDGSVDVLEHEAAAKVQFEPIDVESRVVVFYAHDGTWLEPRFNKPNRSRLFGLVRERGEFELVRNAGGEGDAGVDTFDVALSEAAVVNPNPHFATTHEIRDYVHGSSSAPRSS